MKKAGLVCTLLAAGISFAACTSKRAEAAAQPASSQSSSTETEAKEAEKEEKITIPPLDVNVPILRDAVAAPSGFGRNIIFGAAVSSGEYRDDKYMNLIFQHFNAVTLGNELKLDCMNGYYMGNRAPRGIESAVLNGKTIQVPSLDYSRANAILDKIVAWNEAHPQTPVKVRGHVLVWHSQAPEWFFHKDYDASQPYVTKEEMDTRLEWYIKTILEYYTSPKTQTGKKYGKYFYGWDVVNEAISDATGTYRSDTEPGQDKLTDPTHGSKSSWWKVYQSNEFIINAFRYANKYAPPELELYYNDYNECTPKKVRGIVALLKAVKDAPGTRISAMGMQGHYSVYNPDVFLLKDAVRAYAEVVGTVMITELDMKASSSFNGTNLEEEYLLQAKQYRKLYTALLELDKEPGITISGITFWGVTDPYSWLQGFSGVGGGADGKQKQCPLLFDGAYKPKPAFYAFTDDSRLDAILQTK